MSDGVMTAGKTLQIWLDVEHYCTLESLETQACRDLCQGHIQKKKELRLKQIPYYIGATTLIFIVDETTSSVPSAQ